ncbi:MAG: DUF308 domain-containing protein [Sphaerochaetaceae bacterium]|jgi:uncharacterized membrane protein HdeD (DUF308 family)
MKKSTRWITYLLIAILILIAGVFVLIRQDLFKQIFVISLGVAAVIVSVVSLIMLGRYAFTPFYYRSTLMKGVLGLIVGVLAIVMPLSTAETIWTIILYILAAQLVLGALISFVDVIALRKLGYKSSYHIWEGVISLVIAVVLFIFPQELATMLVTIVGLIIIVIGLTLALIAILWLRKLPVEIQGESTIIE